MTHLPIDIIAEMHEWPRQWNKRFTQDGRETLEVLLQIWQCIELARFSDEDRENCLRTLWILGFEASRDELMDRRLPREVSARKRIFLMIEDGGPLLFGFYAESDVDRFEEGCQAIERALRIAKAWYSFSAPRQ